MDTLAIEFDKTTVHIGHAGSGGDRFVLLEQSHRAVRNP
jgi:hypothetical protein